MSESPLSSALFLIRRKEDNDVHRLQTVHRPESKEHQLRTGCQINSVSGEAPPDTRNEASSL